MSLFYNWTVRYTALQFALRYVLLSGNDQDLLPFDKLCVPGSALAAAPARWHFLSTGTQ